MYLCLSLNDSDLQFNETIGYLCAIVKKTFVSVINA